MAGRGRQWDIIEVKGGYEPVREAEDLLDVEEHKDEGEKEVAESFNFKLFWLISFLTSLAILDSFLLITFSSFFISVSSLDLFILSEEFSFLRFFIVSRALSRFLF